MIRHLQILWCRLVVGCLAPFAWAFWNLAAVRFHHANQLANLLAENQTQPTSCDER